MLSHSLVMRRCISRSRRRRHACVMAKCTIADIVNFTLVPSLTERMEDVVGSEPRRPDSLVLVRVSRQEVRSS